MRAVVDTNVFLTMNNYHPNTSGQRIAGIYDKWYAEYDEAAIGFPQRFGAQTSPGKAAFTADSGQHVSVYTGEAGA